MCTKKGGKPFKIEMGVCATAEAAKNLSYLKNPKIKKPGVCIARGREMSVTLEVEEGNG